jgi:hypothetical protein
MTAKSSNGQSQSKRHQLLRYPVSQSTIQIKIQFQQKNLQIPKKKCHPPTDLGMLQAPLPPKEKATRLRHLPDLNLQGQMTGQRLLTLKREDGFRIESRKESSVSIPKHFVDNTNEKQETRRRRLETVKRGMLRTEHMQDIPTSCLIRVSWEEIMTPLDCHGDHYPWTQFCPREDRGDQNLIVVVDQAGTT